jgi:hypothetical protein
MYPKQNTLDIIWQTHRPQQNFSLKKQRFKLKIIINHCVIKVINPLTPNDLQKRRAVSSLKINIPSKYLGRQLCAEGFHSGLKRLTYIKTIKVTIGKIHILTFKRRSGDCFI